VYCHWDGYLAHNGATLIKYYTSREKINELFSLGCLSSLKKELYPDPRHTHSFDNPQKDVCVFYTRDRGDDFESNQKFQIDLEDVNNEHPVDYCYFFTKDNKWMYFCPGASDYDDDDDFLTLEIDVLDELKNTGKNILILKSVANDIEAV
ncbi:MAG: hypothetical protein LBU04_00740, partial [Christensenellaceae bacterium]|jgi:hypothetical protein|nr:hypothetical protein [Christensenellaceae bacterium]